jgi:hypothetical protein
MFQTDVAHFKREILGGQSAPEMLDAFKNRLLTDVESLLDRKIQQVQAEAGKLMEQGAEQARGLICHAADQADLRIEHTITKAKQEAEQLIVTTLDRVQKDSERLIQLFAQALANPQSAARQSPGETQAPKTHERSWLPWAIIISGLINAATLIVLFALHR